MGLRRVLIDYDGRLFGSSAAETAGASGDGPLGHYHQRGELVWAEFAGGAVRQGRLVGTCAPDGTLEVAYCQVLDGGAVLAGRCTSIPHRLPDGRVRLEERWQRFDGATGTSWIDEVARAATQYAEDAHR